MLHAAGLLLYAFATQSWMMFAITVMYCLGGSAGPAVQSIIASEVPSNAQGELQAAFTELMSSCSVFGPFLINGIFAYYTHTSRLLLAPVHFPALVPPPRMHLTRYHGVFASHSCGLACCGCVGLCVAVRVRRDPSGVPIVAAEEKEDIGHPWADGCKLSRSIEAPRFIVRRCSPRCRVGIPGRSGSNSNPGLPFSGKSHSW